MKKRIAILAVLALMLTLLAGCAGTTVIYTNQCTCPTGGHTNNDTNNTPDTAFDEVFGALAGSGVNVAVADAQTPTWLLGKEESKTKEMPIC